MAFDDPRVATFVPPYSIKYLVKLLRIKSREAGND